MKKQRYHFASKGPYSQSYGIFSSHRQMWELNHTEDWELKNWCFKIVVLEKILESSLDCKEIKPVHHKGSQPWIFNGRTDAEVEATILCSPDVKSQLIRQDPDAGKDWRQKKKRVAEDEMVGLHHWLNGHEFEQLWETVRGKEDRCAAVHGVSKSQTQHSNWTLTQRERIWKGIHTNTHMTESLCYTTETQYCKSTIIQFKKKHEIHTHTHMEYHSAIKKGKKFFYWWHEWILRTLW